MPRVLAALFGAWIALSVSMAYVATANFRVTDVEKLRNAETVFAALPEGDERRMAVRYIASELNRSHFRVYDRANLVLGACAALLFLLLSRRRRFLQVLLGGILVVTVVEVGWLTRTIVEAGRVIDFMPRDPRPEEVTYFYKLHGLSLGLEGLKLLLLVAALTACVRRRESADAATAC